MTQIASELKLDIMTTKHSTDNILSHGYKTLMENKP